MKKFIELHERDFDRDSEPCMINIDFIEGVAPARDENGEFSELVIHGNYVQFHETYGEIRGMIANCQGGMPVHPWGRK